MIKVYDLDGSVICSKHRHSTLPDGTLDLQHWIENSTSEKVAKDKLLPLAETMRLDWQAGHTIVVCTARVMGQADVEYLNVHGLNYHEILSRPIGCGTNDAELKEIQLREYAQKIGYTWARFCLVTEFYDDADSVLQHLESVGLTMIDSKIANLELRALRSHRA